MVARTSGRQVIFSNHEFESLGLWPVTVTSTLSRRKRFKFLTSFGLFAVCAAGAVTIGAALAFMA